MIKRTLYFGSPAYLSKSNAQLVIKQPEIEKKSDISQLAKTDNGTTIPIEDIGVAILDHPQITITQGLLAALLENNTAVITCDGTHHPSGLLLPLSVHNIQAERFRAQIDASEPLKKQLWQQTISAKIFNQAMLLKKRGVGIENMLFWSREVKSGDAENHESRAAAYYWKNLFRDDMKFTRDRFGEPPNNLLNYGYAILRAIVARGLVGSGLLPTLGIHHTNKYNAYALADDIMEPYRPFVDAIVCDILDNGEDISELSTSLKKQLFVIPVLDIMIAGERSPLMVGLQRTTASLAKCFEGNNRKVIYPEFS